MVWPNKEAPETHLAALTVMQQGAPVAEALEGAAAQDKLGGETSSVVEIAPAALAKPNPEVTV